ncbi:unnamed protein product [Lampetra planeri]
MRCSLGPRCGEKCCVQASTRTYQCTCHPAVRCRGLTSDALRRSPPPLSLSHPQRLPSEQGPVSLRRCDDDHGRAEEEEDAAAAADKEVDQLEEAKEEEDDDDDDTSQHWRDGAADAAPSPAHPRCCSTRGEQPVTAAALLALHLFLFASSWKETPIFARFTNHAIEDDGGVHEAAVHTDVVVSWVQKIITMTDSAQLSLCAWLRIDREVVNISPGEKGHTPVASRRYINPHRIAMRTSRCGVAIIISPGDDS